ncbi:DNA-processing protein DprA [Maritalea porphyrae]|uniref:DNA processing protein DprA n=1 Tax=Maritalea porphyrae TaxID=880732 RepID=A0ABQ5UW96_9HYPH|nr:DNA-processing protein DprA [Maritalea porphyrae]GLQ18620.1 DNA processing protein DprA [Maritalea porphyrae]
MQLFDEPEPPKTYLTDNQKLAWLRLIRSENVGPATFKRLINRYGTVDAALGALPALAARGGAAKPIKICPEDEAMHEIERLHQIGGKLIALGEPDFPPLLAHASGAPPLLSVLGQARLDLNKTVAIVGARNASAAGMALTRQLAAELGQNSYTVVSGLARGIDSAAHVASVQSGTVAVFAGGVDHIYPEQNRDLAQSIVDNNGLLVSEMPIGTKPIARDFPRRNRIVAGMSLGVLVVEAAIRSGSLITARLANEQNRDVMAIPGFPLDPRAAGGNKLIRDGATLVRNIDDILEELTRFQLSQPTLFSEDEDELIADWDIEQVPDATEQVLSALSHTPIAIDEVIRATNLPAQAVQMVLLDLEIAGRIERSSGQLVNLKLTA